MHRGCTDVEQIRACWVTCRLPLCGCLPPAEYEESKGHAVTPVNDMPHRPAVPRFQVGRRLGIFTRLVDMNSPKRLAKVDAFCMQHDITPDNVDGMIDEMMKRFI